MLNHAKNKGAFWQRWLLAGLLFLGLMGGTAAATDHTALFATDTAHSVQLVVADDPGPPPPVTH